MARKAADDIGSAGRADLAAKYFEPVAAVAGVTLLGLGIRGAETLRRWGHSLARVMNNCGRDPRVEPSALATADDAAVAVVVERLRAHPNGSVVADLLPEDRPDADVLRVLRHIALSVLEPGRLAGWTLTALWSAPDQLAEVCADRPRLDAALSESIRWAGLVRVLRRRTTRGRAGWRADPGGRLPHGAGGVALADAGRAARRWLATAPARVASASARPDRRRLGRSPFLTDQSRYR